MKGVVLDCSFRLQSIAEKTSWCREYETNSHIASATIKQRAVNVGALLTFSYLVQDQNPLNVIGHIQGGSSCLN